MEPTLKLAAGVFLLAIIAVAPSIALGDDEIFEIAEVETQGRVVAAHFADFDGDDNKDLMVATLEGMPPLETRKIHVYLQREDGAFPDAPSHSVPIPPWSAVYDVADLMDTPGDELVLLRPDGVSILSVADESARQWDLPVDGPSTIGAGVP